MSFLRGWIRTKHRGGLVARSKRAFQAGVLVLAASGAAGACAVPEGPASAVVSVARTGEIVLADGRIMSLAGVDWPGVGRSVERDRAWRALERLARGGEVRVASSAPPDRWGRRAASLHISAPDGPPHPAWAQGVLASLGLVRAWPDAAMRACWTELLRLERSAREAGLGVWSPLAGRVSRARLRKAGPAPEGSRIVFEGRVRSVREGRSVVFINFAGAPRASPFLSLNRRELPAWRAEGLDPATFSGKRLRVRGVIARSASMRMDVSGPLAVEVME